jgi:Na+/H+ antiporter NhaD/arsenite permease-like protein
LEVIDRGGSHDRLFFCRVAGFQGGHRHRRSATHHAKVKPEKVYREIDWSLLALFVGLFIVIAGVEKTSLSYDLAALAARFRLDRVGVLSLFSAAISNLVSNVPAVLVFRPLILQLQDPSRAWLSLAMSSTLAGNLTLLGSIANLIVVERARHVVKISFLEYLKVGVPLTALTMGIGILLLRRN